MGSKKLKKKNGGKKSGVKISWKIKNQKSWKKSAGEKKVGVKKISSKSKKKVGVKIKNIRGIKWKKKDSGTCLIWVKTSCG